jgi:hypothetical protein
MTKVSIREPIWKTRSVGILEYVITEGTDIIDVDIQYRTKSTNLRHYPEHLYIDRITALSCPLIKHKGARLRIVPIALMSAKLPIRPNFVEYKIGKITVKIPISKGEECR